MPISFSLSELRLFLQEACLLFQIGVFYYRILSHLSFSFSPNDVYSRLIVLVSLACNSKIVFNLYLKNLKYSNSTVTLIIKDF